MKMGKRWKIISLVVLVVLVTLISVAGYIIHANFIRINTPVKVENEILLIPTGSTLEDVIDSLSSNGQILSEKTFRFAAEKMNYKDETIRKGRYELPFPASNRTLVSILRGGRQTPLSLTVHNVRTMDQLCGRVANKLEFDSLTLVNFMHTRFDSIAGTTPETRLTRFIPNTYEFYWTVTPEDFVERMLKEHDRFWNEDRLKKAEAIGLTPEEVYTLASIVEKETNYNPEKPRMAGVYINRLDQGWPLQADPTVVFAIGDFEIKRILYGHLEIDSPYNTYKNTGLPPGPIYMPGINSIDAVLHREDHDYLFFCARPTSDGPGHAFAETLSAHNVNAKRYQRWLDQQGI